MLILHSLSLLAAGFIDSSACVDSIDSNMHSAASQSVAPHNIAQGELKGSGIADLESAEKVLKKVLKLLRFFNSTAVFFKNASNGFRSAFHNRFFPHHATMRPVLVLCWVHVWPQAQKISLTPHPPKKNTWPLTWRNEQSLSPTTRL